MKIRDILHPDNVIIGLQAADKNGAITLLAGHCASSNDLPAGLPIAEKILERETEVSTGIGFGIAIPHARLEKIDRLYMAAARSAKGIDFSAIDGQPVHLIFMLVSPAGASSEHMQVLSSLSRIMTYEDIRKKLLAAKTPERFIDLLVKSEKKYVEQ